MIMGKECVKTEVKIKPSRMDTRETHTIERSVAAAMAPSRLRAIAEN